MHQGPVCCCLFPRMSHELAASTLPLAVASVRTSSRGGPGAVTVRVRVSRGATVTQSSTVLARTASVCPHVCDSDSAESRARIPPVRMLLALTREQVHEWMT